MTPRALQIFMQRIFESTILVHGIMSIAFILLNSKLNLNYTLQYQQTIFHKIFYMLYVFRNKQIYIFHLNKYGKLFQWNDLNKK